MNHKRSYLDTLNAGRQRRPSATLEQITQSLQNLESRIDRARESYADAHRLGDSSRAGSDIAMRHFQDAPRRPEPQPAMRRPEPQPPLRRPEPQAPPRPQQYQTIARDLDRIRGQEEGVASASRIASEIKSLRDDLRQQMSSNLQREFETLRSELDRSLSSSVTSTSRMGSELASEIERISGAISNMAERGDDRNLNLLRLEIEQVKRAVDKLAREDSVQNVDRRWDEFDRRWTDFERKVDARHSMRDPEITILSERLQAINDAIGSLPDSVSLRSLEDKVRMLAGALDQFMRQQEAQAPETFRMVEERLDEISRAIVASTAAAQAPVDPEPFERIEARISSLARQIEEVADDRPTAQIIDRLHLLSQRVDELAEQSRLPERAVERLAGQIAAIAEKIERAPVPPNPDTIFQGIEQRFDILSAMIERRQGDALEQGNLLFRDLERRLEDVADRIDMRASDTVDHARVMSAIDFRFAELADQLAGNAADANAEAARAMEARLDDISSRLEASARDVAKIDPNLIRSLESQVAALSDHLNRPASPLPELEDIGPRLDEIERSISGSRDTILEAAREAAENAVRSFNGSQTHTAAVSGLAEDLRALETLTRRSDERNARTFEAIHDTLIKIVDRLGALDPADDADDLPAAPPPARARKIEVDPAPPLVPYGAEAPKPAQAAARTPAQAAADAAIAAKALAAEAAAETPEPGRTLLGGIGRALSGRKDVVEHAKEPEFGPTPAPEPASSLEEPLDPKIANRPLQPGSGAPDLNAIMKRVREEKGQTGKPADADAAKADFIAAARRAAQAAAAEAEILKRTAGAGTAANGSRFGEIIKDKRKPILMAVAAVMVALAGLQLGQAYLKNDEPQELSSSLTSEPSEEAAASDLTFEPTVAEPSMDEPKVDAAESQAAPAPSAPMPEAPTAPGPFSPTAPEAAPLVRSAESSSSAAPASPVAAADSLVPSQSPAPLTAGAPATETPAAATSLGVPADAGPLALREAANAGDAKALFEVASRYSEGRGVKQDMAQAAKWYEKAADLGFAPAQYRIGNFYEKGLGVDRDIAKSKTWYQLSAEQGNASAMHNLAVLYAMGADGATDNESAVRWFRKAAEFGVRDSQFNLGILAAKGVGMKQDLEESYRWFALVAKAGDRDAGTKRDEIANSLRPEQLERARAAAELWKPQPLNEDTNSVEIPESWQETPATTASVDVDMKKAIGNIQRILNKNGYEAGSADGVMGQKTKTAIMAFQKDNDMKPTGEIDEALVKALLARK